MAKKKEGVIEPKCDYCLYNLGENKRLGYMWQCEVLGYCVPFDWTCEAQKKGKGEFKMDKDKYNGVIHTK